MLYGASRDGGFGAGAVFRFDPNDNSFSLVYRFGSTAGDGGYVEGGLAKGVGGILYGTTSDTPYYNGAGTVFRINEDGSAYGVLRRFLEAGGDGRGPGVLVDGRDGWLYGITTYKDDFSDHPPDDVLFKLRKDGTGYKILLTFTNSDTIGVGAVSLVAARDGFLYGTTSAGGSFNGGQGGGGTLYKLNRDGSGVEIVRTFAYVACPFGCNTIIEGRDGVLYSTSETAGGCGDSSLGVKAPLLQASDGALYGVAVNFIFKVNPEGGYTNLYSFADPIKCLNPLVEGADGALYCATGYIFKINKNGSGYTVLFNFAASSLIRGSDGFLYGTRESGGSPGGGTVFRFYTNASSYSVFYNFGYTAGSGWGPDSLMQTTDGSFFGTTFLGGNLSFGTIFKLMYRQTPTMILPTIVAGAARIRFTGTSGYRYRLLRSTNLDNWSVLAEVTMPSTGIYPYQDSAPLLPAAYYRAAWLP